MSKRFALAFGMLVSAGAAASAADLPSRQPPLLAPEPIANWAGFYAGTTFGGGYTTFKSSQLSSRTVSKFGQTGGGLLGYNFQNGPFVYGLEGDIALHVIRRTNLGVAFVGGAGLAPTVVDTLYSASVRGRLGYDLGAFLPFVAAGFVGNETYQRGLGLQGAFGDTKRLYGYTLGAGLEYRAELPFIGPFTIRGEYVYEGYGAKTFNLGPVTGLVRTSQNTQIVRLAMINQLGVPGARVSRRADPDFVDWSGPYGGVIGGGAVLRTKTTAGVASSAYSASGALGGIYVGQNFAFGRFIVGVDAISALTDERGSGRYLTQPSTTYRNYIEADVRARAGYAFGRFLPFVAAGVVFGRSEQRDRVTGSELGRVPTDSLTIGAGLDYRIADHVSVRGEYLFANTYKKPGVQLDNIAARQSQTANIFRLGLAYHLN